MALVRMSNLWPSRYIAFEISDMARKFAEKEIYEGVADWNTHTCVRLLEYPGEWGARVTEHKQILVNPQRFKICWNLQSDLTKRSHVHEIGWKKKNLQYMHIDHWVDDEGIVHEIGHLLGLYHEQQRPDRDDFVFLDPRVMLKKEGYQYYVKKPPWAISLGAYDCKSIMHYPRQDNRDGVIAGLPKDYVYFSVKDGGACAGGIGPTRRSIGSGDFTRLSQVDIDVINEIYRKRGP